MAKQILDFCDGDKLQPMKPKDLAISKVMHVIGTINDNLLHIGICCGGAPILPTDAGYDGFWQNRFQAEFRIPG